MDLRPSKRSVEIQNEAWRFMEEDIFPAERLYYDQIAASDNRHAMPPVMDHLKSQAKERGLWNLFLPDDRFGAGLLVSEYAPIAEITGWSPTIAPRAMNCNAPDTGNMQILAQFGTPEQQETWLRPLLDGEIRSAFSMTERDVSSGDATNIATTAELAPDTIRINGHKWFTSGAANPDCKIAIVMCRNANAATDPDKRRNHTAVLVPLDTPGVEVRRSLPVLGYDDGHTHCEVIYHDVAVPAANILGEVGQGFAVAQARLGPGRIHHSMRMVGAAERALRLLCERVVSRTSFGRPLAEQGTIRDWIAEARMEINAARLVVLDAAWQMDEFGTEAASLAISAAKVRASRVSNQVLDRSMQAWGATGLTEEVPLARMYAVARTFRLGDGPDEVHVGRIARRELRQYEAVSQPEAAPLAATV